VITSRVAVFGAFVLALSAMPVRATPRVTLLVEPARADFDHDGRPDTAAGVLTNPDIVRVTLSRTGIHDIVQPAPVVAIAGFDYDRDGDVDLVVGTADGAVVWVNDGAGAFSPLGGLLPAGSPGPSSSTWTAAVAGSELSAERNEHAGAQNDRDGPRHVTVLSVVVAGSNSGGADFVCSSSSPRAPPSV
jgi:hypothetical protein